MNNDINKLNTLEELRNQIVDSKLSIALLELEQQKNKKTLENIASMSEEEKNEEERFFSATEDRIFKSIKTEENKRKNVAPKKRKVKITSIIAAIIIISAIGFVSAMATSTQFRVNIIRMLYEITPQYTEIVFDVTPSAAVEMPPGWSGIYYPTYIPEGYELEGHKEDPVSHTVIFTKGKKYIRFIETELGITLRLNTEGFTIEYLKINGYDCLLAYRDDYCNLSWSSSDKAFIMSVSEGRETALKIAKSVMIIK